MNYKCIAYKGGGIFSILMDLVIPHLYKVNDIENIYIEIQDNEYGCPVNGFDFVFDQVCDESYKVIDCGFIRHVKVDKRVKEICKKFKIKDKIINSLTTFPDSLGVHYRGADMNDKHFKYGVFGFSDYKKVIPSILKSEYISALFVASDNLEAIDLITEDFYADYVYSYRDFIRAKSLEDDTLQIQVENSGSEKHWIEVFTDMITLSRCKSLLCRRSNLSNAAIAFSDTLTKIYRL